jgi:propionyl-CoA carboxylase alpha chain
MFYDPMIAKLITWGQTREQAIDKQIAALDRFEIDGIGHNVDFLSTLMQHGRFRSGDITTGFIAEEFPEGFTGARADEKLSRSLAAIAGVLASIDAARGSRIEGRLNGPADPSTEWVVTLDKVERRVEIDGDVVYVDGNTVVVDAPYVPGQRLVEAIVDGEPLSLRVERKRTGWRFTTRGASHELRVLTPTVAALSHHMIEKIPPDMSRFLLCPMPGLVTAIHVEQGARVEAGQPLAVVEAMKMENILRAEKAGTVKAVAAKPGDSLAVDAVIIEFE